jgi:hypothetical protein
MYYLIALTVGIIIGAALCVFAYREHFSERLDQFEANLHERLSMVEHALTRSRTTVVASVPVTLPAAPRETQTPAAPAPAEEPPAAAAAPSTEPAQGARQPVAQS